MLDVVHYLPEVIGGAGAYAAHSLAHRTYHVLGGGAIRLLRAVQHSVRR
jgi:hypothetical protein